METLVWEAHATEAQNVGKIIAKSLDVEQGTALLLEQAHGDTKHSDVEQSRNLVFDRVEDLKNSSKTLFAEQADGDVSKALEISLPRNLSSPDKATREKALAVLGRWLSSCKHVEESDLAKIWQGIFYCVWQTDKGAAQVELSKRVAVLLGSLNPDIAILAFKVLLSSIMREWGGIEKKKIEKFRSLLRDCLSQMFRVLEAHGWDNEHIRKFAEAFGECSIMADQGVNVYLAQGFVEELRSFTPCLPETLTMLLEPFFAVFATSTDRLVLQKVRDAVFLPLLQEARVALGKKADANGDQNKCLGSLVLGLPLAGKFFELAASPSVSPVNKKFLNQLYEDFSNSDKLLPKRPSRKMKQLESPKKLKAKSALAIALPSSSSNDLQCSPSQLLDGVKIDEEANDSQRSPQEKAGLAELSATGNKRRRVNVNGSPLGRRVLRSEQRLLNAACNSEAMQMRLNSSSMDCDDPVVLNFEDNFSAEGESDTSSLCNNLSPCNKRKRKTDEASGNEGSSDADSPAKKVRFSLKNNIVWTPHRPLPPQWVRVPPCAAPRGSAMKKGVLPGPIQVSSPKKRSSKRRKSTGARKAPKSAKKKSGKGRSKGKKRSAY